MSFGQRAELWGPGREMLGSSYPTIYILLQVIATEMHPGTLRTSLTLALNPLLGALLYFSRQECNLCLTQTPVSLSVDRGMQTGTHSVFVGTEEGMLEA